MATNPKLAHFYRLSKEFSKSQKEFFEFLFANFVRRIPARYTLNIDADMTRTGEVQLSLKIIEKYGRCVVILAKSSSDRAEVEVNDYDDRSFEWLPAPSSHFTSDPQYATQMFDIRSQKLVPAPPTNFIFSKEIVGFQETYDFAQNTLVMDGLIQRLHDILAAWRKDADVRQ